MNLKLSQDQFELLSKISNDPNFDCLHLTQGEFEIFRYLLELGFVESTKFMFSPKFKAVEATESIMNRTRITEAGKSQLSYEIESRKSSDLLLQQIIQLTELVNSTREQAEIAKKDSEASSKFSRFSNIIAGISLLVSIIATILSFVL